MSNITEVLNNLDEEKKNIEKSINDQWMILHKASFDFFVVNIKLSVYVMYIKLIRYRHQKFLPNAHICTSSSKSKWQKKSIKGKQHC